MKKYYVSVVIYGGDIVEAENAEQAIDKIAELSDEDFMILLGDAQFEYDYEEIENEE